MFSKSFIGRIFSVIGWLLMLWSLTFASVSAVNKYTIVIEGYPIKITETTSSIKGENSVLGISVKIKVDSSSKVTNLEQAKLVLMQKLHERISLYEKYKREFVDISLFFGFGTCYW